MARIEIDLLANLGGHTSQYTSCPGYLSSNVVRARRHLATPPRPIRMEELSPRLIDPLVSMGAEEVSLRLQQVCRQASRAEPIVKRKRRGESRSWHAGLNRLNDATSPGGFVIVQHLAEEIGDQQIGELRILIVSFLNLAEEAAADN